VAYIVSGIYFICALLEAILVPWDNKNLPELQNDPGTSSRFKRDQGGYKTTPGFYAIIVIAARLYSSEAVGWYFNACIIYFCLSAANTALYVASRAAFGLCRGIHRMDHVPWYLKLPKYIGTTSPIVEVPHWALLASTVAFFWLPYLELRRGYSITDVSLYSGLQCSKC
jgi:amino acid transporter